MSVVGAAPDPDELLNRIETKGFDRHRLPSPCIIERPTRPAADLRRIITKKTFGCHNGKRRVIACFRFCAAREIGRGLKQQRDLVTDVVGHGRLSRSAGPGTITGGRRYCALLKPKHFPDRAAAGRFLNRFKRLDKGSVAGRFWIT
jgi:hypothetical protein